MSRAVLSIFAVGISITLSNVTLINAYGLSIHSWNWLIVGSIASAFFGALILAMGE